MALTWLSSLEATAWYIFLDTRRILTWGLLSMYCFCRKPATNIGGSIVETVAERLFHVATHRKSCILQERTFHQAKMYILRSPIAEDMLHFLFRLLSLVILHDHTVQTTYSIFARFQLPIELLRARTLDCISTVQLLFFGNN